MTCSRTTGDRWDAPFSAPWGAAIRFNIGRVTELMAAQELIDVVRTTVVYDGREEALDKGRLLLHAVNGEDMVALCGQAQTRLLPTGWSWDAALPGHLARCATCIEGFPLAPR